MNMKLLSISLLALSVVGCASAPQNVAQIGTRTYTVDADGALLMSKADIKEVIEKQGATFIDKDGTQPYVELTEAESQAISVDHRALYTMMGINNDYDGEIVTLVKEGSLRENVSRILQEQGWQTLDYDGPDMIIEKPYVVRGNSVDDVILNIISDYPVFFCADEDAKILTLIQI